MAKNQKILDLQKMTIELINNDSKIESIKEQINDLGYNFSNFEFEIEINDKLELEIFNDTKLKETRKLLNKYNLDSIDVKTKNFILSVDNLDLSKENLNQNKYSLKNNNNEEDSSKYEIQKSKDKIIQEIEEEVNELLKQLNQELSTLNIKIESMIQTQFVDLKDNSDDNFKDYVKNSFKSFKVKRIKSYTKYTIFSNITKRKLSETLKYEKEKVVINSKIFLKDGASWEEINTFFKNRSKYKDRNKSIKLLLRDVSNYIDEIIEEQYTNLVQESFRMNKFISKKYKAAHENDELNINIDKRHLVIATFKELNIFFTKNNLNSSDFKEQ